MITLKNISPYALLKLTFQKVIWIVPLMGIIAYLYNKGIINFYIPWLPISVIGTAVSFYVGFKNNQSYDRMWEARKIWGGIVNESRTWGMMIDGFISNLNTKELASSEKIHAIKRRLIYRHIAWLYALRSQLLIPTSWEHINQNRHVKKTTEMRIKYFGIGLYDDAVTKVENMRAFRKCITDAPGLGHQIGASRNHMR